jgi:hypothetical protein
MDTLNDTTLAGLRREVARISIRCPELAGRAESAAAILLVAKVAQREDGSYEVFGAAERPYTVDADARTCTCLDYAHRGVEYKARKFCKHVLSVLLLAHLSVRPRASRSERIRPFRRGQCRRAVKAAA